jgi:hypothetical protein
LHRSGLWLSPRPGAGLAAFVHPRHQALQGLFLMFALGSFFSFLTIRHWSCCSMRVCVKLPPLLLQQNPFSD